MQDGNEHEGAGDGQSFHKDGECVCLKCTAFISTIIIRIGTSHGEKQALTF